MHPIVPLSYCQNPESEIFLSYYIDFNSFQYVLNNYHDLGSNIVDIINDAIQQQTS